MKVLQDSEIRNRAYLLWEAAGRPNLGSNEERNVFWFQAQRELAAEASSANGESSGRSNNGDR
jgi:hypothetical protein